jgi:hypothetical protein
MRECNCHRFTAHLVPYLFVSSSSSSSAISVLAVRIRTVIHQSPRAVFGSAPADVIPTEHAMNNTGIAIHFPDVTPDLGNVYAEDLQAALAETLDATDRVERRRTDPESQDFGATLVLILGTTAITAIAEGIRTWLARHSGVSIDIVVGGKTVRARNLDSQGVQELAKVIAAASLGA